MRERERERKKERKREKRKKEKEILEIEREKEKKEPRLPCTDEPPPYVLIDDKVHHKYEERHGTHAQTIKTDIYLKHSF